jgi:hypothetical protein
VFIPRYIGQSKRQPAGAAGLRRAGRRTPYSGQRVCPAIAASGRTWRRPGRAGINSAAATGAGYWGATVRAELRPLDFAPFGCAQDKSPCGISSPLRAVRRGTRQARDKRISDLKLEISKGREEKQPRRFVVARPEASGRRPRNDKRGTRVWEVSLQKKYSRHGGRIPTLCRGLSPNPPEDGVLA